MTSSRHQGRTYVQGQRPLLVSVVGYIELLAGFIGMIYAGVLFFSLWFQGAFAGGFLAGVIVGGFELVISLITLAVGVGLLQGRGWAWEFAIFISLINIVIGIIQLSGAAVSTINLGIVGAGGFTGAGTIVICLVALYYLFRPNVRAFFRR